MKVFPAFGNAYVNNGNAFGGLATLGTTDNQALRFFTNNAERIRLLTGGAFLSGYTVQTGATEQIGIQATSAIIRLTSTGSTLGDSRLYFNSDGTAIGQLTCTGSTQAFGAGINSNEVALVASNTSIALSTGNAQSLRFLTNAVARMLIDSSGFVTINGANASTFLNVRPTALGSVLGVPAASVILHGAAGDSGANQASAIAFRLPGGTTECGAMGGYSEAGSNGGLQFLVTRDGGANYTRSIVFGQSGTIMQNSTTENAFFYSVQRALTSGSPTAWRLDGGAHTTLAATVEAIDVNLNLARTVQFATGAITTQRAAVVQAPTYGFVAASTITNAATLAITGAPVAGVNATITNAYALWIQGGISQFDGSVRVSGLAANGFLYSGTSSALTATAAPTNGQLLIGSTGVAPVAATLTAGSNITITNGAGSITIASTGGYSTIQYNGTSLTARTTLNVVSRGLLIADDSGGVTRLRGMDPLTQAYWWDDFTPSGISNGTIGTLGWGGAGTITVQAAIANHPGIVRADTGAVSGTIAGIATSPAAAAGAVLLSDTFDGLFICRVNTNDANTLVRIGFFDINFNPPTNGAYFEKLAADTNWFRVTRSGGVQTRTDTAIAIDTAFHRFRVRRISGASIGFTIDANAEQTNTTNLPTNADDITVQIVNSTAASKTIDIDYIDCLVSVTR